MQSDYHLNVYGQTQFNNSVYNSSTSQTKNKKTAIKNVINSIGAYYSEKLPQNGVYINKGIHVFHHHDRKHNITRQQKLVYTDPYQQIVTDTATRPDRLVNESKQLIAIHQVPKI